MRCSVAFFDGEMIQGNLFHFTELDKNDLSDLVFVFGPEVLNADEYMILQKDNEQEYTVLEWQYISSFEVVS